MKARERQKLIRAYKNLESAEIITLKTLSGFAKVKEISEQDMEILRPFLHARYSKTYQFGDIDVTLKSNMMLQRYIVGNSHYVSFAGGFDTALQDIFNMVEHVLTINTPAKYIYQDE